MLSFGSFFVFFFNDTATTEIYTLSLHDALPISIHPESCNIDAAASLNLRKVAGELATRMTHSEDAFEMAQVDVVVRVSAGELGISHAGGIPRAKLSR